MMKICKKCGDEKPIEDFSPCGGKKNPGQRRVKCKPCEASSRRDIRSSDPSQRAAEIVAARNWKIRNPEKVKDWYLKDTYGISLEQYHQLLEKQGGKCAICSDLLAKIYVDHCHESGVVRGLLCITCNTGLGKFGDSIELLQKAVLYLQKVR